MQRITTYQPLPISFVRGEGVWLYDNHNNKYLDTFTGIAVCGLGHAHPEITKVIQQQAAKLLHVSNGFLIPEQQKLAEKLCNLTNMQQAFFANSGCEANEAALKLTRLFAKKRNISNPIVITLEKSFHGRTLATLSASGSEKLHKGFEPLIEGFVHVALNDFAAINKYANNTNVVAVMFEPVQGEAGINIIDINYMKQVAELCKNNHWLLIVDEVQSGNGRTGQWFAYQHAGIHPDVLTTAKGLGNGYPVGACLMANNACDLFMPGNHGSTFGGNPLAMSIGIKVLEIIEENDLVTRASVAGEYLLQCLKHELQNVTEVIDIRGKGLMVGIELNKPAKDIKQVGLKNNLLLNVTAENVIRLLPALNIADQEIEDMVFRIGKTIREL
jgi:acetylornithine/N-succinyldiaminopimelate aminotransferase